MRYVWMATAVVIVTLWCAAGGVVALAQGTFTLKHEEPKKAATFEKDPIAYMFSLLDGGGSFAGDVTLDGRSYRVRVIDANEDGDFSDVVTMPIDTDREPKCDMMEFPFQSERPTVFPLPRMLWVRGKYYTVSVAQSGESITLTQTEPQMGTLAVPDPAVGLTLFGENGYFDLAPNIDGMWALPVGKYVAMGTRLEKTDALGAKWTLGNGSFSGLKGNFEIRSGESSVLKAGPPLSGKAQVLAERRRQLGISVVFRGQGGEEYIGYFQASGMKEPTLKILNEEGRELASGKFEFG
jgi:hypothetical protein